MNKKFQKIKTYCHDPANIYKVIVLRFGQENPPKGIKARHTMNAVAKYLKVEYSTVRRIERSFFTMSKTIIKNKNKKVILTQV